MLTRCWLCWAEQHVGSQSSWCLVCVSQDWLCGTELQLFNTDWTFVYFLQRGSCSLYWSGVSTLLSRAAKTRYNCLDFWRREVIKFSIGCKPCQNPRRVLALQQSSMSEIFHRLLTKRMRSLEPEQTFWQRELRTERRQKIKVGGIIFVHFVANYLFVNTQCIYRAESYYFISFSEREERGCHRSHCRKESHERSWNQILAWAYWMETVVMVKCKSDW